jgi:hypothetical protein
MEKAPPLVILVGGVTWFGNNLLLDLTHLSGTIATIDTTRISIAQAKPHIRGCLGILGIEVIVLSELRLTPPEHRHTTWYIGTNEPCLRTRKVVVQFDTFWQGIRSLKGIDSIVCGIILEHRLHDPISIVQLARGDVKGHTLSGNLEATIHGHLHDLDVDILKSCLTKVSVRR